jgi:arylsulfatase A-like enzyme
MLSSGTLRLLGLLAAVVASLAPTPIRAADAQRKPNIIFILADDLGWTDLGCYGSKYYETPNIDRLRAQGLKFTTAYTCGPNCAPTRACLMTGRYSPRHGIYTVGSGARGQAKFRKLEPVTNQTRLPLTEQTVAEVLKAGGYTTGMFGKWHLGNDTAHHPLARGFDRAIVSAGRHFNFNTVPKVKVNPETYLADFLTDQAVKFIEDNRERSFFLYLPHFAVHTPLQAKKELIARFEKKKAVGGHHNPVYAAMIASLDESVGRVLAKLDELKLADQTLVIFSSDNGGVGGYARAGVAGAKEITDNTPLRGGKGMLYEGGIRVPFIVRWPGKIRPGSTCDQPLASIDLLPTLRDVAEVKARLKNPVDGVSLLPLLQSSGKGTLNREALFWHFPGYLEGNVQKGTWRTTPAGAIHAGDLKLIEFFETGKAELYNVKEDIGEKSDLSEKMPEKARELRAKLAAWRAAVKAPLPRATAPR